MIARIWNGWTSAKDADLYERVLRDQIFPSIRARQLDGFLGAHLLRRADGTDVAFQTIMWFVSLDAVRAFAGDDYERAYVPAEARAVLTRFDARSLHFEVREAT